MSECGSCKLVSQGKGRTALCYDCLEAENAKLREAAQAVVDNTSMEGPYYIVAGRDIKALAALLEKSE